MGDPLSREVLEGAHCWEAEDHVQRKPSGALPARTASKLRDRYLPER